MPTSCRFVSTAPPSQQPELIKSLSELPPTSRRVAMGDGLVFLLAFVLLAGVAASDDLAKGCGSIANEVDDCVLYGTGRRADPGEACCTAADDVIKNAPQCLCYVIQQVSRGNSSFNDVGLKLDRLLSLPRLCNLKSNISICRSKPNFPRPLPSSPSRTTPPSNEFSSSALLKLSPNDTDYSIFNDTGDTSTANIPLRLSSSY